MWAGWEVAPQEGRVDTPSIQMPWSTCCPPGTTPDACVIFITF